MERESEIEIVSKIADIFENYKLTYKECLEILTKMAMVAYDTLEEKEI